MDLSIEERTIILISCSVWKNSAEFWMSSDIGLSFIELSGKKRVKAKEILAADGISAGIGMLGVAAAGALGPIGWGALALGIGGFNEDDLPMIGLGATTGHSTMSLLTKVDITSSYRRLKTIQRTI